MVLIVRDAQVEILGSELLRRDLDRLARHARQYFGAQLRGVGEGKLARFVERVAREARRYELGTMRDVLLFLNLSMVHGEGFLSRPELAWMKEMLTDPEISSPAERMRLLYDEAVRRAEGPRA